MSLIERLEAAEVGGDLGPGMTAQIEALITDLEALLAGEPVFVVGHPVSRSITALRALQNRVEELKDALVEADLTIRSMPGTDQSHVEFIRSALTGSAQK